MKSKTKKLMFGMVFLFGIIILVSSVRVSAIEENIFIDDYEIVYSYSSAEEGDTFTLTVSITNTDNTAKEDVFFELRDTGPFDTGSEDEWDIGILEAGEEKTKTFRIEIDENTAKGNYDLEIDFEDRNDRWDDEFEIEVSSDKADFIIGNIISSPEIIMPDEENIRLDIMIENTGGGAARFIKTSLELPEGIKASSSYSDTANLGVIEKSMNKQATFFIDTEKTLGAGNKEATLVLEYESDNNRETQKIDFNIPVKGKPLFNVISSSTNPSVIEAGTEGNQLSIRIQNIGEETGKETSVRIFENSDQPFEFNEKTNFIGNLEPGKSGTASFEFDVDSDAVTKEYIVKVQTRTVNRDNVIVSEENIRVNVSEKQSSFDFNPSLILVITLLAGIIILFILLFILIRKR